MAQDSSPPLPFSKENLTMSRELTHPTFRCSSCCCPGIHEVNETTLAIIGKVVSGPLDDHTRAMMRPGDTAVAIDLMLAASTVAANLELFKEMCHQYGGTDSFRVQLRQKGLAIWVIGNADALDVPEAVRRKVGRDEDVVLLSKETFAANMAHNPTFFQYAVNCFGCACTECEHLDLMRTAVFPTREPA
jgi:hypothetical protein